MWPEPKCYASRERAFLRGSTALHGTKTPKRTVTGLLQRLSASSFLQKVASSLQQPHTDGKVGASPGIDQQQQCTTATQSLFGQQHDQQHEGSDAGHAKSGVGQSGQSGQPRDSGSAWFGFSGPPAAPPASGMPLGSRLFNNGGACEPLLDTPAASVTEEKKLLFGCGVCMCEILQTCRCGNSSSGAGPYCSR